MSAKKDDSKNPTPSQRPLRGNSPANAVVLITGGSKGIGKKTAMLFGQAGCALAITGRDAAVLEATGKELKNSGFDCLTICSDVSVSSDCRRTVAEVVDHFGRLDILINNAGMSMRGKFEHTDLELFDKVMDINFTGAVHMTKYALPHLISAGGSVCFVSTLAALKGLPGIAPYSTAKMALTGFSQSLQAELRGQIHIGVLYVSLVENDSGKTVYDSKGNLLELKRAKNASTQEEVARALVKMVTRRQSRRVMTLAGKLADKAFALMPRLTSAIIGKFSGNSKSYT